MAKDRQLSVRTIAEEMGLDKNAVNGKVQKSSPRPKKACMSRSRVKTMIIVFLNSRGIEHKEFVHPGQTVNHAFYKDVLERL